MPCVSIGNNHESSLLQTAITPIPKMCRSSELKTEFNWQLLGPYTEHDGDNNQINSILKYPISSISARFETICVNVRSRLSVGVEKFALHNNEREKKKIANSNQFEFLRKVSFSLPDRTVALAIEANRIPYCPFDFTIICTAICLAGTYFDGRTCQTVGQASNIGLGAKRPSNTLCVAILSDPIRSHSTKIQHTHTHRAKKGVFHSFVLASNKIEIG